MKFHVVLKKKVEKQIHKMPEDVQLALARLLQDLRDKGPIRKEWPNFSSLGENTYHCHLKYKWIACWTYEQELLTIEVYYAGSRENAPY
jgi:hypothetical protein